jgi:hypothetical protein
MPIIDAIIRVLINGVNALMAAVIALVVVNVVQVRAGVVARDAAVVVIAVVVNIKQITSLQGMLSS